MTSGRILEGVRVLDFGRYIAGAYATRWLADMGAEVLKVEPPGGDSRAANLVRDETGALRPVLHADTPAIGGFHAIFLMTNAGKQSICIDMKAPGAIDLIRALVREVDVVLESFTPHVFDEWGLGYDELRAIKPDIIVARISGYGQDSPDPRAPCTHLIASAMGGLCNAIGFEDDTPLDNGFGIADPLTATVTALGVLAALIHRMRTGEGQLVDTAMVDALAAHDAIGLPFAAASHGEYVPMRHGRSNLITVPHGICRVGNEYLAVQAGGTGGSWVSGWGRLCALMHREDLVDDPEWSTDEARARHEDDVWELIEGWVEETFDDAETAAAALRSHQILASKVYNPAELIGHPHIARRQMIVDVDHPLVGPLPVIASPIKFSATPSMVNRAPLLGEHNEQALGSWLGYSRATVETLYGAGVLQRDELVTALRVAGDLPDPWEQADPSGTGRAGRPA
jgi:CoA:oxalate CoA-transferase